MYQYVDIDEVVKKILLANPNELKKLFDEVNRETFERYNWNWYYIDSYHSKLLSQLKSELTSTQKSIEGGTRLVLVNNITDYYSYHPKEVLSKLQRAVEYFSNPPTVEKIDD